MELHHRDLRLPMRHAFTITHGTTTVQHNLFVELRQDGMSGYGEAAASRACVWRKLPACGKGATMPAQAAGLLKMYNWLPAVHPGVAWQALPKEDPEQVRKTHRRVQAFLRNFRVLRKIEFPTNIYAMKQNPGSQQQSPHFMEKRKVPPATGWRQGIFKRHACGIELLEARIAPATLVWKGVLNSTWSVAQNWIDNGTGSAAAPADGDTLIFDDTSARFGVLDNDTVAGTSYSLIFNANGANNYTVTGNSILLDNPGVDVRQQGTSPSTVDVDLTLAASVFDVTSAELVVGGAMSNTGFTKNGTAVLTLSGANTFTGAATIGNGVLRLGAHDTLAAGLTVSLAAAGSLDMNGFAQTLKAVIGTGTVENFNNGVAATLTLNNDLNGTSAVRFQDTAGDLNLVKAGNGNLTLAGASSHRGSTMVNAGVLTLTGDFTGSSPVTVSAGATIEGNGDIAGAVTVLSNGIIGPGVGVNGIGKLGTGDLSLGSNSTFNARVNNAAPGTGHDQLFVTGTVSLGDATLVTTGGITSNPGQQIILVDNSGNDMVVGTFNGLSEGAPVTINGVTFNITYAGGSASNDVVLMQAGVPAIETSANLIGGDLVIRDVNGGASDDTITLKRMPGGILSVFDPSHRIAAGPGMTQVDAFTVEVPLVNITGTLFFDALGGSDTLVVDFGGGSPVPAGGIDFSGGNPATPSADRLLIEQGGGGVAFANVTHTFTTHDIGVVDIDGALISYSGVEETLNTLIALERSFTYPAANEAIILADDAGVGLRLDGNFGGNPHLARFAAPGTQLTVNAGAGVDSITVSSLNPAFGASLTINGDAGDDLVQFTGPLTFAPGENLDVNLSDDAGAGDEDAITVGAGAALTLSGAGAATFDVSRNITFASGSSLVVQNGNLTLSANAAGTTAGNFIGVDVNAGLVQATGTGVVSVTGRAGDAGGTQVGVHVRTGGDILGGTTGTMTVTGGGGASTGEFNFGVAVDGSGSTISSGGANVQITGTSASTGAGNNAYGVYVNGAGALLSAGGTGTVTVMGTGSGSTAGQFPSGVHVQVGGTINSSGGNVSVTGIGGGTGAAFAAFGVGIYQNGTISAGGAGTLTVTGTGGTGSGGFHYGVSLAGGSGGIITSGGGALTVTGTGGTGGGTNNGIQVEDAGVSISTATNGGNLTLIADNMNFAGPVSANGSSSVTLRQQTNGTLINLGGADSAGVLGLTDAELDQVTAGALVFGDQNSGPLTVSAPITRAVATNLVFGAAATLDATVDPAGGDLTFASLSGTAGIALAGNTLAVSGGNYTGLLSGTGDLVVAGTAPFTLANAANTFTDADGISLTGRLAIGANGALGTAANDVVFDSTAGRLHTTATFSTARTFTVNSATGTVDVDAATTLTLTGTVDGPGTLRKAGIGTLVRGAVTTVGTMLNSGVTFSAGGGTTVRAEGAGDIIVNVSTGGGGRVIDSIEIISTAGPVDLYLKGPKIGTTTVNRIVSSDPDSQLGTITLNGKVKLGDGVNDALPDVEILGSVTKLILSDVNQYGIFEIGKGLAYLDTYNNKPEIRIRDVLGTGGLTIDVTGTDPLTPSGGGGLGDVVVRSWAGPGLIKTTQSIDSFRLRKGLCQVSFEVDRYEVGTVTYANLGNMTVSGSSWAGQHVIVNGNVGTITVTGTMDIHLDAALHIKGIKVKGTFKSSVFANSIGAISAHSFDGSKTPSSSLPSDLDYDLVPVGGDLINNGVTMALIETSPGVPDLNGDDYGHNDHKNIVAKQGAIGLIKIPSTVPSLKDHGGIQNYDIFARTTAAGISMTAGINYSGSIGVDGVYFQALSFAQITSNLAVTNSDFAAYDITNADLNIGIGKIKITAGTVTNARFLAGVSIGADGLIDSVVPPDPLDQDTYYRDARIGTVTIAGVISNSTVSAGIDPGTDHIWGNADDVAAAGVLSSLPAGKAYIDAIVLTNQVAMAGNCFQGATFKSIKVNGSTVLVSSLPQTAVGIQFRVI